LSPAVAQEFDYPVCNISDSLMTRAVGLDEITHAFGEDTETYPNEFDLADRFWAFSQVFELYVTKRVSERWYESDWEGVIGAIMNNDTTTTTDDVFGRGGNTLCGKDRMRTGDTPEWSLS
jgi:hypothetical protein